MWPRTVYMHGYGNDKWGSDFIAIATYYRIEIKIAQWHINLFYAPRTLNMKLNFGFFFAYLKNFRIIVLFLKFWYYTYH